MMQQQLLHCFWTKLSQFISAKPLFHMIQLILRAENADSFITGNVVPGQVGKEFKAIKHTVPRKVSSLLYLGLQVCQAPPN